MCLMDLSGRWSKKPRGDYFTPQIWELRQLLQIEAEDSRREKPARVLTTIALLYFFMEWHSQLINGLSSVISDYWQNHNNCSLFT